MNSLSLFAGVGVVLLTLPAGLTADVGVSVSDSMQLAFTNVQEFNSGPLFGRQGRAFSNAGTGSADGWGAPELLSDGFLMIGSGPFGEYDGFGPEAGDGWNLVAGYGGTLLETGFLLDACVMTLNLGFTSLTNGQSRYPLTVELTGSSTAAAWRADPADIGGLGVQSTAFTFSGGHFGAHEIGECDTAAPWLESVLDYKPLVFQVEVPPGPPEYGQSAGSIEIQVLYTGYYSAVPTSGAGALLASVCGGLVWRRRGRRNRYR